MYTYIYIYIGGHRARGPPAGGAPLRLLLQRGGEALDALDGDDPRVRGPEGANKQKQPIIRI